MKTVSVIAFKNKDKDNRFLSNGMDAGDWSDEDLDVHIDNIENAFMIWRKDFSKPTENDVDDLLKQSQAHKKLMIKRFGDDAIINFDVENWLIQYEPINLEITKEQFQLHLEWLDTM
ncbi:hypothetical protein [Paraliobacillus salinarum]|uniref:hypothetical protein n=1 Tax=Paraliobacillus salinarum TaxID=1158996 RepID=UPI0015F44D85|nr:hypothetical protein [Paraliobacillus salinarum]